MKLNGEHKEQQHLAFLLTVCVLKATSNITTVHIETQSRNIRPDLKARGWEGGGGGGGG